jgi:hypothetical protein
MKNNHADDELGDFRDGTMLANLHPSTIDAGYRTGIKDVVSSTIVL